MGTFVFVILLFPAFLIAAAFFIFIMIPIFVVTFIKERKKYRQMYNTDAIMLSYSEEFIENLPLDTEQSAHFTQEYD